MLQSRHFWIKRQYIYIMDYYSTITKNDILSFAAPWMYLKGIMLNQISQTQKDKYHMIPLIVGSKQQNKQTKQKQSYRYRKQTDGCQRGGVGGWAKKVKGLRSTNWQLQTSHGDGKYSLRNTVNNITITMYGARLVLDL